MSARVEQRSQSVTAQIPVSGEVRGGNTHELRPTRMGNLINSVKSRAQEGDWLSARTAYAKILARRLDITEGQNKALLSRFRTHPEEVPFFTAVPSHMEDFQSASRFLYGVPVEALTHSQVLNLAKSVGKEGNPNLIIQVNRLLESFPQSVHGRVLADIIGERTGRLLDELKKKGKVEITSEADDFKRALDTFVPPVTASTRAEYRPDLEIIENVLEIVASRSSDVSQDQLRAVNTALEYLASVHRSSPDDADVANEIHNIVYTRLGVILDVEDKLFEVPDQLLRVALGTEIKTKKLNRKRRDGIESFGLKEIVVRSSQAWEISADDTLRSWPEDGAQINPDITYAVGGIIHLDHEGKPFLKVASRYAYKPADNLYFDGLFNATEQMLKGFEGLQVAFAVRVTDEARNGENGTVYTVATAAKGLLFEPHPSKREIKNLPRGASFSLTGRVIKSRDDVITLKTVRAGKVQVDAHTIRIPYKEGDVMSVIAEKSPKGKTTVFTIDTIQPSAPEATAAETKFALDLAEFRVYFSRIERARELYIGKQKDEYFQKLRILFTKLMFGAGSREEKNKLMDQYYRSGRVPESELPFWSENSVVVQPALASDLGRYRESEVLQRVGHNNFTGRIVDLALGIGNFVDGNANRPIILPGIAELVESHFGKQTAIDLLKYVLGERVYRIARNHMHAGQVKEHMDTVSAILVHLSHLRTEGNDEQNRDIVQTFMKTFLDLMNVRDVVDAVAWKNIVSTNLVVLHDSISNDPSNFIAFTENQEIVQQLADLSETANGDLPHSVIDSLLVMGRGALAVHEELRFKR